MLAAAKYAFKATNKRLLIVILILGIAVGSIPTHHTEADEMGVILGQSSYTDGAGGTQGIDVYQPGQGSNHPGIIFVHGGGWRVGDKNQYVHLGNVAAARGYTAYSIDYRLGASGTYFQFEDVMRAVASIRQNAPKFGTDPNRIGILGDSAGGSLAMRVAASGQTGLAAAIGWSAPVNAYTAIFNSLQSFAIGLDHSTCVPIDPTNYLQNIPQSEGGTASNSTGTSATQDGLLNLLGQGNSGGSASSTSTNGGTGTATNTNSSTTSPTSSTSNTISQVANAANSATGGSIDPATISTITNLASTALQTLASGASNSSDPTTQQAGQAASGASQILGSVNNNARTPSIYDPKSSTASAEVKATAARSPLVAFATHTADGTPVSAEAQRLILGMLDAMGCQDNFRVLSPALNFASNTPPTFLVNSQDEYLVNPGQAIEYSNNLRNAGIDSSYLILPGANHMGYDERAVEPTFAFLDQHLHP